MRYTYAKEERKMLECATVRIQKFMMSQQNIELEQNLKYDFPCL